MKFHKEYQTGSYKKSKQEAFFSFTQGSQSVKEYVNRFEDLYRFISEIIPLEEIKCNEIRSGLKAYIKTGIAWYEGNNFREVVRKTLVFEKARKEEIDKEHKNKRFIFSSSQSFRDRPANRGVSTLPPRPGYSGSGRGSHVSYGQ